MANNWSIFAIISYMMSNYPITSITRIIPFIFRDIISFPVLKGVNIFYGPFLPLFMPIKHLMINSQRKGVEVAELGVFLVDDAGDKVQFINDALLLINRRNGDGN